MTDSRNGEGNTEIRSETLDIPENKTVLSDQQPMVKRTQDTSGGEAHDQRFNKLKFNSIRIAMN